MKKSIFCLLALISLCMYHATAQTFQNIIGTPDRDEQGLSMAQDANGNIVVAGTLTKAGKDYPLFLTIKPDGTLDKAVTINELGGTISNSVNIAAVNTAGGRPNGFIVALNYAYDVIVIRVNSKGEIMWSKTLSASSEQPIRILPVYSPVTNYLAGFYLLANPGTFNHTLIRLTPDGDIVWQKRFRHPLNAYGYYARNMLPTEDGGCIVVGERKEKDIWHSSIAKFGPNGALLFSKSYDFFSEPYAQITAIAAVNGGYVLSGLDYFNLTFKIDTIGNVLWANRYTIPYQGRPKTIVTDNSGNIAFGGPSNYNFGDTAQPAWIIKLNSSGNVIFSKKYYYHAEINDLTLTSDGYCAIGTTERAFYNGPENVYILKTDFSGNVDGNCTASPMAVTKTPNEFIDIADARLSVKNDTFKIDNVTLTLSAVNNLTENWCGSGVTASKETAPQTTAPSAGTFKAFTNIAAKDVQFVYSISASENSKYEVVLYNSNGNAVAKKPLQPNMPVTFSMAQQLPGMYMAVLLKNGSIVEKQNVIWAR